MPSAPCAAVWRCSSSARCSAPKSSRARPRRLQRPRRHPHRRRAAGRRRRCRRQHPRHRRQHRRPHGADRAGRRSAHQPRHLRAGARPVRGRAAAEPLPVKGVDEPVAELPRRSAPSRASFRIGTRGIEGVATRMVGRDAELEQLQDAFKRLFVPSGRLAVVTVVADAGIGKSRLLYEFEAWTEARPESFYLFRGRATPQTQSQPFGLLRDILAWRCRSPTTTRIDAARAKIEARHRAALRARRRRGPRRRPRPPAGPPDRHRLTATAATSAASSTTPSRSATAPSMRRRRCFAASRPATAAPSCCNSKTCTGPTTRAWTS